MGDLNEEVNETFLPENHHFRPILINQFKYTQKNKSKVFDLLSFTKDTKIEIESNENKPVTLSW
jgi:hypothetical protein